MDLRRLTMDLCALCGPSGFEDSVSEYVTAYAESFADEVKTDALGNVLAFKRCGKEGAGTLLLDAHMDEIGFVVTGAEEGFLRFSAIGGIDPRMLPAREVRVLTDRPMFGVICTPPPHVLSSDEMEEVTDMDRLCIDVGLTQEEAERQCPPGTPVVFSAPCSELGDGLLCGKALDDRACAAIVLKAFETLSQMPLHVDLCLLISTQEEVGCRGAVTGAWNAAPDHAIVVDTTFASTPDKKYQSLALGKGPAIGVGPNMDRRMTEALMRLAREKGIPAQTEVLPGHSGTNAEVIQVSREGVASALVSLPIRYMHTPVETASLADMENTLRLIVEYAAAKEG